MAIYVEISIRGTIDDVWRLTQTPTLHQRWDLRFSSIQYLERAPDAATQRFRYAKRLAPGIEIEGWGETAGDRHADGTLSSALRFGSEDARSIIRAGAGYWKYEQVGDRVRFLTGYDYDVRWGAFGRAADRVVFRPLIGWATAWSFDRLRLWIERGLAPEALAQLAVVHALATAAVAFVWAWHGLVPKLLGPHPDEIALLTGAGLREPAAFVVARIVGVLELAFGLVFPFVARERWPWLLTIALMAVATVGVLATAPEMARAAFGPVTLNLLLAGMAGIGLVARSDLPSAGRCLRTPPKPAAARERT